jgi:tRNA pseudouridine32 synthase/23S rRNA pseudouridine746 synthase
MSNVSVVFEHCDFIIVDKPIAVTMHRADGNASILLLLKDMGYENLYLVHRLDTDTSGLLILARHQKAAAILSLMFSERHIGKYYLALSDKRPLKKQGHICGDMKNIRNGNYVLTREQSNPAYTQFFSQSINGNSSLPLRLFILKPFTGKSHQLRVALRSIGAPILGDPRYSQSDSDRMYLHAWALRFEYQGQFYEFSQPPIEGEFFQTNAFQHHALLNAMPWTMNWPSPRAGFVAYV